MKTRLQYIDIAKGFAIIAVVMGHVLYYDLYGFNYAFKESPLMQFIYSFHLPLFFFLSGFVARTKIARIEILPDLWKRFRQLIMPCLFIGGIYSLYIFHDLRFVFDDMKQGYWYLWVLFYLYCINYMVNKVMGDESIKHQIVIYAFLIVIWMTLNHFVIRVPSTIQSALSLAPLVRYMPFFFIGNAVKRFGILNNVLEKRLLILIFAIVWLSSRFCHFKFYNYISSTAAVFVVIWLAKAIENICLPKTKFIANALTCTGRSSLYIYVFHYFFLQLFMTDYFRDFLIRCNSSIVDFVLCTVPTFVCILLSLVLGYVIETQPLIKRFIFGK